jgi:outer membrane receptor protein involved in Fe transport
MKNRFLLFGAMLVLIVLVFAGISFAQTSNGTITGTIADPSGAVIPGANVKATPNAGGESRTSMTDNSGSYRLESLFPGMYTITVAAQGFSTLKIENVDVKGSLVITINGKLTIGATSATVNVEAGAAEQLQTQSGELSHSIGKTEINQLPISSLNPIQLVLTEPGVQNGNGYGFSNGFDFSVNGTRPRSNNFLMDGQDNNDNSINGQAYQPTNLEAVGEVTILTNAYSAEYGRGGGSVTNVITKGGTNQFHGSAYDINRNSYLAAIPIEDKIAGVTKNPVDNENIYGYSVGGPILKDKLFFFNALQWDKDRSTANGSTLRIPTASGIATLQSLGTNANVAFMLASLGGMVGTSSGLVNVALGNGRQPVQFGLVQRSGVSEKSDDRQLILRLDYQASKDDTITVRLLRDVSSLIPDFYNYASALPPYDTYQGGPSGNYGFAWTHIISSRSINEFRWSYGSFNYTFGFTAATASNPLSALPAVTIANITSSPTYGESGTFPQGRGHQTYQFQDAFAITLGRHSIKIGADVTLLNVKDTIPFNSRGSIGYTAGGDCGGGTTCTALANFVDNFTGPSGAASIVAGTPVVRPFAPSYAPYIQDNWRLRPNLTLDLGLRYEYWGTLENVLRYPAVTNNFGVFGTFPQSQAFRQEPMKMNWAPRVGIAYTPHIWPGLFGQDKTVLRMGYGMFYDGLFTNILDNTAATPPNVAGGTITAPSSGRGLANANGLIATVAPVISATGTTNSIVNNLMNPKTHQWNFDIQRQLPFNFILTTAYVGTRGEHMYINQQYNPVIVTTANVAGLRLNPARGGATIRTNGGDSIYHGLNVKLDRRFTQGMLFRAAYTWSKLIDNGSEVFTTTGGSSVAQFPFNQSADRGLSAYDRRQRLVLTYVWQLPYFHNTDQAGMRVLNSIIRDWQVSGTFTVQSGIPGTFVASTDMNGDGTSANDRPFVSNPNAAIGTVGTYSRTGVLTNFFTGAVTTPDQVHWVIFPSSTFVSSAGFPTVGRNTFTGPNSWGTDFSLQRAIKIPIRHLEDQALTIRAEFFNVFNHPNQGNPSLNVQSGVFMDSSQTWSGGRYVRLMLRYSF